MIAIVFGFVAFGLVFMGMMFVLPYTITHTPPSPEKGAEPPRVSPVKSYYRTAMTSLNSHTRQALSGLLS